MEKNDFLKLKPMLLDEIEYAFDSKDYIFEIKFDGMRALIFIDDGKIIIKSRRGIVLNSIFPELLDIANITNEKCILDGEIVLIDKGIPSFSKLQERSKLKDKYKIKYMKENYPVSFVCFDILYKNIDLTNLPLMDRKKILNKFLDTKTFVKSKVFDEHGINLFEIIKKNNLEGIIAKKKNSIYSYGKRVSDWLKIKNLNVQDFFVCGFIEHKNKNILTIILGEKREYKFYFVGKVLLSYKNDIFDKIKLEKNVDNYLDNYSNDVTKFIKPKYTIKIGYMERTKKNLLRQPIIKK